MNPPPPRRTTITRAQREPLWTLREYEPDGASAHCTLCKAGDTYELIVEGIAGGALRWSYHSIAAAQMGAARLHTRLIERGWTESECAPREAIGASADHDA
jgi:hypothetical protein